MSLTPKQRSFLRGKAHNLSPVVRLGKEGVSDSIIKTTDKALEDHELIKVKVPAENQEEFLTTVGELMAQTKAEVIQKIGHLLVIYRKAKKPGRVSTELESAPESNSRNNRRNNSKRA